jgi:hypothetical protein
MLYLSYLNAKLILNIKKNLECLIKTGFTYYFRGVTRNDTGELTESQRENTDVAQSGSVQ